MTQTTNSRNSIARIGNLYGFTGGSFAGMIYSPKGIAPTINTSGGAERALDIAV